ncbi:hypothetical protein NPIL_94641 [Nephila pilipes]|uniref:Uncharacterized protein n=1 Tax=Nephila pilipes TaxID=299642 RepID=A0A8X6Q7J6_NEPPI|nr:hypothetical protein NPIL_94641 [Nephila pilipes]
MLSCVASPTGTQGCWVCGCQSQIYLLCQLSWGFKRFSLYICIQPRCQNAQILNSFIMVGFPSLWESSTICSYRNSASWIEDIGTCPCTSILQNLRVFVEIGQMSAVAWVIELSDLGKFCFFHGSMCQSTEGAKWG